MSHTEIKRREVIVGTPERDVFKVGVYRYTEDTAVTIDVDVCLARSAVRKTKLSGVIGKGVEWV